MTKYILENKMTGTLVCDLGKIFEENPNIQAIMLGRLKTEDVEKFPYVNLSTGRDNSQNPNIISKQHGFLIKRPDLENLSLVYLPISANKTEIQRADGSVLSFGQNGVCSSVERIDDLTLRNNDELFFNGFGPIVYREINEEKH